MLHFRFRDLPCFYKEPTLQILLAKLQDIEKWIGFWCYGWTKSWEYDCNDIHKNVHVNKAPMKSKGLLAENFTLHVLLKIWTITIQFKMKIKSITFRRSATKVEMQHFLLFAFLHSLIYRLKSQGTWRKFSGNFKFLKFILKDYRHFIGLPVSER